MEQHNVVHIVNLAADDGAEEPFAEIRQVVICLRHQKTDFGTFVEDGG